MLKHTMFAVAAAAVLAACSEAPQAAAEQSAPQSAPAADAISPVQIDPLATPEERLAQAEAFLAANGAREGVTTTSTGLQYEVLAEGPAGGPSPAISQWVCVHYRGTLIDGTEFDSSYSRNEAMAFQRNGVISGWVEALGLMKAGDALRLAIHPDLAYGTRGVGPIAPNSALLFDVSLIKVLDGEPPAGVDCAA